VRLQRGGSNRLVKIIDIEPRRGPAFAHLGERGDDRRRHIGLNGGFELFLRDIPGLPWLFDIVGQTSRHRARPADGRNLVGTGEVFLCRPGHLREIASAASAPTDCPRLNAIG
jgi:hypothetical protein